MGSFFALSDQNACPHEWPSRAQVYGFQCTILMQLQYSSAYFSLKDSSCFTNDLLKSQLSHPYSSSGMMQVSMIDLVDSGLILPVQALDLKIGSSCLCYVLCYAFFLLERSCANQVPKVLTVLFTGITAPSTSTVSGASFLPVVRISHFCKLSQSPFNLVKLFIWSLNFCRLLVIVLLSSACVEDPSESLDMFRPSSDWDRNSNRAGEREQGTEPNLV